MKLKDLLELVFFTKVKIFDFASEECIDDVDSCIPIANSTQYDHYKCYDVEMIINNEKYIEVYVSIK